MIALAHKDLFSVPAETLPLRAIAPTHHSAPAGQGANRKVLEVEDLLDDRTGRRCRQEANVTRRMTVP